MICRPPVPHTLHVTLHIFVPLIQPALLQKLIVVLDIAQLDPSALALDFAEDPIFVVSILPVERAVFGRAGDAARGSLFDVDVGEAVVGGVLLDGQGYGCEGNGFAEPPAYALLLSFRDGKVRSGVFGRVYHLQDSVGVVGEGLVLLSGISDLSAQWGACLEVLTMTHTPDRSFSVFSGGAAMVVLDCGMWREGCFSCVAVVYKSVCLTGLSTFQGPGYKEAELRAQTPISS